MTRCVCNLLKAIWSFILGSLRFILFFGCIILILVQLVSLCISVDSDSPFAKMPGAPRNREMNHIYDLALLVVALIGAYGSFFKNHASLKFFSVAIVFLCLIMFFLVMNWLDPKELEHENEKFRSIMKGYMKEYDWTQTDLTVESHYWDNFQHLMCCGLDGPKDWDKYRPSSLDSDAYPRSCCFQRPDSNKYCHQKHLFFSMGCIQRVEQIQAVSFIINIAYVIFMFLLGGLAFFISFLNVERCSGARNDSGSATAFLSSAPNEYHRVNIRQPPYNEAHFETTKPPAPQIYPSLGEFRRGDSPPTYGTRP